MLIAFEGFPFQEMRLQTLQNSRVITLNPETGLYKEQYCALRKKKKEA